MDSLAEVLGLAPPDLPSATSTSASSTGGVTSTGVSSFPTDSGALYGPASKWADEEEKRFYEDLVDLKDEVPGVFLGLGGGSTAPTGEAKEEEAGKGAKSLEEEMEKMQVEMAATNLEASEDKPWVPPPPFCHRPSDSNRQCRSLDRDRRPFRRSPARRSRCPIDGPLRPLAGR